MRLLVGLFLLLEAGSLFAQAPALLRIEVRSASAPLRDADVVISGITQHTDAQGVTVFTVLPGHIDIVVVKEGYAPAPEPLRSRADFASSPGETLH